ncbi:hypothetical protein RRG08_039006, partial [Elysia crispata]
GLEHQGQVEQNSYTGQDKKQQELPF